MIQSEAGTRTLLWALSWFSIVSIRPSHSSGQSITDKAIAIESAINRASDWQNLESAERILPNAPPLCPKVRRPEVCEHRTHVMSADDWVHPNRSLAAVAQLAEHLLHPNRAPVCAGCDDCLLLQWPPRSKPRNATLFDREP